MQVGMTSFRFNASGDTISFTDVDGAAFVPEHIYFISGTNVNNKLWFNGTGLFNTWSLTQNLTKVAGSLSVMQAGAENPQFGTQKVTCSAAGNGSTAFYDSFESDAFGAGNIFRRCTLSAVGSGFFTYAVTQESFPFPTDVIALCIRGVEIEYHNVIGAVTVPTSFDPKGIWCPKFTQWLASGSLATGAGGPNMGWGWDSPNGGPSSIQARIVENNYRYVTTNSYEGTITSLAGSPTVTDSGQVTDWGTEEFTVSGGSSRLYVIGGDEIQTASGSFELNNTLGEQTFDTTIWAHLLFTVTVGMTTEDTAVNDYAEICFGITDGVNASSFWVGESRIGNTFPLLGASYLSTDSLIRAVDNAGVVSGATVFGTESTIVELNQNGTATIDITTTDAKARKVYWFAIGEAAVTPPTPVNPGGIYKLVPQKKQDTVWLNSATDDEALFKIPDPNAYTALVGDE